MSIIQPMMWIVQQGGGAAPSNGLLVNCLHYYEPDNSSTLTDLVWSDDLTIYGASYSAGVLSFDGVNDYAAGTVTWVNGESFSIMAHFSWDGTSSDKYAFGLKWDGGANIAYHSGTLHIKNQSGDGSSDWLDARMWHHKVWPTWNGTAFVDGFLTDAYYSVVMRVSESNATLEIYQGDTLLFSSDETGVDYSTSAWYFIVGAVTPAANCGKLSLKGIGIRDWIVTTDEMTAYDNWWTYLPFSSFTS